MALYLRLMPACLSMPLANRMDATPITTRALPALVLARFAAIEWENAPPCRVEETGRGTSR